MSARDRRDPTPAIDAATAERMLDGQVAVDDAPPGYEAVVALLMAADAPARPDEIEHAPDAIRQIFEEARRGPAPALGAVPGEHRRTARTWSVRAAVVALVASLTLGGGVAMAATGNLPGLVQGAASRMLDVVGISIPDGSDDERTDAPSGSDPAPGQQPAASSSTSTTATTAPTTAPTVPTTATDPAAAPGGVPGRGDEVCADASDGTCRAGEPNPSDNRPDNPGQGGGPPTTDANPSVTRPSGPPASVPGPPVSTGPPVTTPASPPSVVPTPPTPPVPPTNPSESRPGRP